MLKILFADKETAAYNGFAAGLASLSKWKFYRYQYQLGRMGISHNKNTFFMC